MKKPLIKTKTMTLIGIMAAVICILGPLSIPIGPVPVSFTNLAIFITVYILGWKKGAMSYLIYLLAGLVGLPVFSGFSGGIGKLFGPTGGYLIGFLFMAVISGWFIERFRSKPLLCIVGMIVGSLVNYLLGTLWLAFQTEMTFPAALAVGVYPFLIWDFLKIILAAFAGSAIYKRLVKSQLL